MSAKCGRAWKSNIFQEFGFSVLVIFDMKRNLNTKAQFWPETEFVKQSWESVVMWSKAALNRGSCKHLNTCQLVVVYILAGGSFKGNEMINEIKPNFPTVLITMWGLHKTTTTHIQVHQCVDLCVCVCVCQTEVNRNCSINGRFNFICGNLCLFCWARDGFEFVCSVNVVLSQL